MIAVGFTLPEQDGAVEIHQTVPLAFDSVAMIVERYEGMEIEGAGLQKEERALGGHNFWLVRGPSVKPGDSFTVRLSGLPRRSTLGRNAALAIAVLVALWGVGWSWSRRGAPAPRGKLEQRRDELLEKLIALDGASGAGAAGGKAGQQREELVAKLERVYREIDESAA